MMSQLIQCINATDYRIFFSHCCNLKCFAFEHTALNTLFWLYCSHFSKAKTFKILSFALIRQFYYDLQLCCSPINYMDRVYELAWNPELRFRSKEKLGLFGGEEAGNQKKENRPFCQYL